MKDYAVGLLMCGVIIAAFYTVGKVGDFVKSLKYGVEGAGVVFMVACFYLAHLQDRDE